MPDRLLALRKSLLDAGIAPRTVRRYLGELTEHRLDIAGHLAANGMPMADALLEADRRLGSNDVLLLPMLADRRFLSMAARWPALFYLLLPLSCQTAFVAIGTIALLHAAGTDLRAALLDLGSGLSLLMLAAPVLIAWLTFFAAYRRRAARRWAIAGALAGATLAATIQLAVTLPGPDAAGEINLSFALPALVPLVVLALLSLLPLSLQPRLE